jgi:pilus assembly protein Flp/PilA
VEKEEPVTELWQRLRQVRTRRDDGASAVEYGLLVALIAVVIAGTVVALGSALKDRFDQATCEVVKPSTTDTCTVGDDTGDGGTR